MDRDNLYIVAQNLWEAFKEYPWAVSVGINSDGVYNSITFYVSNKIEASQIIPNTYLGYSVYINEAWFSKIKKEKEWFYVYKWPTRFNSVINKSR